MRSWMIVVFALLIAAAPAAAQEDPLLGANPPAVGPGGGERNDAFGGTTQDLWVPALKFQPMNGDEDWDYNIFFYFSVLAGTQAVIAPVDLDAGARIQAVQCFFNDSGAGDGRVELWRNTYNVTTNARSNVLQGTVGPTIGGTGFQNPSTPFNILVRYNEGDERVLYFLVATLTIGDASVSLRGCRVAWARTVSAAPATATFTDVPVGHPQRQFVEALVAAGITGGCGAGVYCPDSPLTRGQMAVFLSVALGLHFPN